MEAAHQCVAIGPNSAVSHDIFQGPKSHMCTCNSTDDIRSRYQHADDVAIDSEPCSLHARVQSLSCCCCKVLSSELQLDNKVLCANTAVSVMTCCSCLGLFHYVLVSDFTTVY